MSEASCQTLRRPPDAPRYQPLVIVAAAVCAGIVADRVWPLPVGAWWLTAGAALAAWWELWRRRLHPLAAAFLLAAAAATGAAWHHCRWYLFAHDDLGYYARADAQPVCIEAVALKSARLVIPPKPDPLRVLSLKDCTRVEIEVTALRDGISWRAASGRAELFIQGRLAGVRAGDRLRIFAQLAAPDSALNPGEFDYARYLRADRRRCLLRAKLPECVTVVAPASAWTLTRLIDSARLHGYGLLERYIDRRRAGLAAAVLLGAREQLDPELTEAFVETGTVHLLVVSGLNVAVLAGALWFLVRRVVLSRTWALASVAAVTLFYMLLADAEPPVVRATILVLGACLAVAVGRCSLAFNSLAAAALVVLAMNPADLFNVGAQLSFLCVAGLAWFAPRWFGSEDRLDELDRLASNARRRLPRPILRTARRAWQAMLLGLMVWLLILPLVMARFHIVTPVAPVLNTLLWLPVEAATISGFGLLVFGWIPLLGDVLGRCCDWSVWIMQSGVEAARKIPGSCFWVPGPADWWLAGFYAALGLLAAVPRIRPPRRWCLALLAGWSAFGLAVSIWQTHPSGMGCTFLAVGHGSAAVLELPSGQTLLFDAGRFGSPMTAARTISGYLWSRGITHVDTVVLSHADIDHFNALPELLNRFRVAVIYVSPVMFEHDRPAIRSLREAIRSAGVTVREIHAGHRFHGGDNCLVEVLHPPRGVQGSDNASSIVLAAEYLGKRILLTGDLEPPGLDDLLAEEPRQCHVLLAPHHGSPRSDPRRLAAWCTPEWIVISGSHGREFRQVESTYVAVGRRFLHTADVGAITAKIDARGLTVQGYTSPRHHP